MPKTETKTVVSKIATYFLYFMMYAVIGWCYEVFLEVVVYQWGFSNRGVLFGPYCPVYGFGALAFIFTVYPFLKNKSGLKKIAMIPIVFFFCMLIATIIELFTSYLCEWIMGSWPWQTYADYKYNFQARIALSPSIRFGIGGVFFLYVLQPLFEKLVGMLSSKSLTVVFFVVLSIFVVDIIHKVVTSFL